MLVEKIPVNSLLGQKGNKTSWVILLPPPPSSLAQSGLVSICCKRFHLEQKENSINEIFLRKKKKNPKGLGNEWRSPDVPTLKPTAVLADLEINLFPKIEVSVVHI